MISQSVRIFICRLNVKPSCKSFIVSVDAISPSSMVVLSDPS